MYSQYRQSPKSRGQRSNKGFKVKHGLQLILLLGVGIWLLYQTQRYYNHNKDKSLGKDANVSERLRLGRKDLPESGDAEMRTHDSNDVKNKADDEKEEAKEAEDEGEKNEHDEKTPSGEMKGDEEDGRIKNLRWSSDSDEKVVGMKQNKDNNVSSESVDFSEDKQANISAFSDETFASHTQNETDDNLGAKIEKGETDADSYQSDSNAGDSAAFSDTNGSEEANWVEIPRPSTSRTNEKSESEQPHTSTHNSSVMNNSEAQKEESSKTRLMMSITSSMSQWSLRTTYQKNRKNSGNQTHTLDHDS